jgi:hypothetical protein
MGRASRQPIQGRFFCSSRHSLFWKEITLLDPVRQPHDL